MRRHPRVSSKRSQHSASRRSSRAVARAVTRARGGGTPGSDAHSRQRRQWRRRSHPRRRRPRGHPGGRWRCSDERRIGNRAMSAFDRVFGRPKPVIAMLHFPGLPGRPLHDREGGRQRLVDTVGADLRVLQEAGVDGLLFCNEADIPYQLAVGPEVPAGMAAVIGELRSDIRVPFGVNILWDAIASLALARATGAAFIREVLTGVYESDVGMIEPRIGEIAGYRSAIGADNVLLFDNVQPEFASAIGSRTVADRAKGAAFLGMDAILISGPAAGVQFAMDDLRAAKEGAGDVPVVANTGVRADRIADIFSVADAAIVGTSLKVDGVTWNAVDPDRAARLVEAAGAARARLGAGPS